MVSNKNFKILVTMANLPTDRLREIGTVVQRIEPGNPTRQELLDLVKDCDAIYCHGPNKIDKELLDIAPKLRVIGTYSVGYNHIDLEECKKRGVKIGYCPGETTEVSAEFGVGLLLASARRILEANDASKDPDNVKVHEKSFMCGKQILGTTIGFFGLGAIGSSMLEKLAPFRPARFIYHNRSRKENCPAEYVSFDELVRESDFLVVTAPLTPETTGKFDKNVFAKMKKGAIFINISRGPLVKTEDLYDALKSGHLEAAGLDVADPEPLPKGHPMLALKNCIVTPHMATSTYRARNRMNDLTVTNIINGLTGKPMLTPLLE